MKKLAEYNDAVGKNNDIKYVIDNLRRERTTFIKIFTNMNDELEALRAETQQNQVEIEQTERERAELDNEIRAVRNEAQDKRVDAEHEWNKLEEKRLEEERLDRIAQEEEDRLRREERERKRQEAKQARARARDEQAIQAQPGKVLPFLPRLLLPVGSCRKVIPSPREVVAQGIMVNLTDSGPVQLVPYRSRPWRKFLRNGKSGGMNCFRSVEVSKMTGIRMPLMTRRLGRQPQHPQRQDRQTVQLAVLLRVPS